MSYREIGKVLSVSPSKAQEWVSEARKHFAELQHIPLETLNLDKPRSKMSDKEGELLDAYLDERIESVRTLPDFDNWYGVLPKADEPPEARTEALRTDESTTKRRWAQEIEKERQTPNNRRRY